MALATVLFCIIGAGPGGLQLGRFFENANVSYVIFESKSSAGSFFATYPRARTLISINKAYTGSNDSEFNLRHDWNSLLDGISFPRESYAYFPPADALVEYLRAFAHDLNVKYDSEVKDISGDGRTLKFSDKRPHQQCTATIIATGRSHPKLFNDDLEKHLTGCDVVDHEPTLYVNKSILIIGYGNSAFEFADVAFQVAARVHLLSRSKLRLAWQSHYVGHLRAKNTRILDSYLLKSLDAIADGTDFSHLFIKNFTTTGKLHPLHPTLHGSFLSEKSEEERLREEREILESHWPLKLGYDLIVRCVGFDDGNSHLLRHFQRRGQFSKFKRQSSLSSFPLTDAYGRHVQQPSLAVAGVLNHGNDFRKSSGGFIHGFRYTARALARKLLEEFVNIPWPKSEASDIEALTLLLYNRIQSSSGLYQMFAFLHDYIFVSCDENQPHYVLFEVPIGSEYEQQCHVSLSFRYGKNFPIDPFAEDRAEATVDTPHLSNFLHPVLKHFGPKSSEINFLSDLHLIEDFASDWSSKRLYFDPMKKWLVRVKGRICHKEEQKETYRENERRKHDMKEKQKVDDKEL